MRIRRRFGFKLKLNSLPDATRRKWLEESGLHYALIKFDKPFEEKGHHYPYAVAEFEFEGEKEINKCVPAIICETEAEANETEAILSGRQRKDIGIFQTAGAGGVCWAKNYQRITNEIAVMRKKLPGGKTAWWAVERETDQDSLEVTVIRSKREATEQEAKTLATQWLNEYHREREKAQAAMAKGVTPEPPPRCEKLTKTDREDLLKAKMTALQRQWPHCFKIFEKRKADPKWKANDQEMENAYLVDLVAQGHSQPAETIRCDLKLISALHKAAERFSKRGKTKITGIALYLIAFNWELGWCYSSDGEIAKQLGGILKTAFNAEQVRKYRLRDLGLVSKHHSGPDSRTD